MRRLKCHVEFCKHHTSAPLFEPRVKEALFSQIMFVWKRIIIWGHMLLLLVRLISASVVELFYSRNMEHPGVPEHNIIIIIIMRIKIFKNRINKNKLVSPRNI